MSWLKSILSKLNGDSSVLPSDPVLPDNLLSALAAGRFDLISPALRDWCASQETHAAIRVLSEFTCKKGWDKHQVEKLEILAAYYTGDMVQAFERARPYVSGELFDLDMFLVTVVSLYRNGQYEDAYRYMQNVELDAERWATRDDYWTLRALVCWAANDMATLGDAADRLCSLLPNDAPVLGDVCSMYWELGNQASFEALRRRLDIAGAQHGYAYALCTLALGDYKQGFRQLEARYGMEEAHLYINSALFSRPRWRGESLRGKCLLVSAEQGLGDTIQMARYLHQLCQLDADRLVMETQRETLTLLQHNFPSIEIIERDYAKLPSVNFDLWTGAMSLPHLSGAPECVPASSGYLTVPPDNQGYWRSRVNELSRSGRPRIGLAWSGHPSHRADRRRSIPFPAMMDAICGVDADFFSLQTHVPTPQPGNLVNVSDELITLADTAALIVEMDLVITVDTSVVHVAGALGKTTWLLLPYRYEWRWGFEGEDNRWYDSVKVIRQLRHGDWDRLLTEVFSRRFPEFMRLRKEG